MKQGFSFSYEIKNDSIIRKYMKNGKPFCYENEGPVMTIEYPKDMKIFEHPYLSWENLSYAYWDGEDELDDYLLYHAMQDNKKTSVGIFTKRVSEVENVFSKDYHVLCNPKENGFSQMFVVRDGRLSDYFDVDRLEEYYDEQGIVYKTGLLEVMLENIEMTELFQRREISYANVPYSPLMDMGGRDGIAYEYGAVALIIAGLLFGYPIESTIALIRCNNVFNH